MPGIIEPFVINQEDSDVTQADGTAEAFQDLFLYRVPIGTTIILRPEDVLAFYAEETDASAAQNTGQAKVEIRDATGTEKRPVLGATQYASFAGEFQDEDKLVHLDLAGEVRVAEREYIALMAKNPSPYLDKDNSYFSLRCHRER
jgi:hypothetical protein